MPNRPCLLAMGAATVVALAVGTRSSLADTNPTLTVRVRDEAHLRDRTVQDALMIAGGVYRRAGVSVRWLPGSDADAAASDPVILLVPAATDTGFRVGDDSLGVARGVAGMRGTEAYIFLDRVREFAERGHIDTWIVLGCAIAHELGHLLLPVNAHASDGIMRAHWDPKLISRAGGFLSFASGQGRLLRLRVASREP
jgi:hypothetical protein